MRNNHKMAPKLNLIHKCTMADTIDDIPNEGPHKMAASQYLPQQHQSIGGATSKIWGEKTRHPKKLVIR